MMSNMRRGLYK